MGRTGFDIAAQEQTGTLWVEAKAIAAASGLTKQWINERARSESWRARTVIGRGGPRSEFLVSSLPVDLAQHFSSQPSREEDSSTQFSMADEQRLVLTAPDYNRRKWEKYKQLFLQFGHLRGAELEDALAAWNNEQSGDTYLQCSASAFRREFKRYQDEGPEAIIGKYGGNRGRSYAIETLGDDSEHAFETFRDLYLSDNQPAAYGCWLRTAARIWKLRNEQAPCDVKEFNAEFPSCATFLRALRSRYSAAEICLAREGFDAFNRKHHIHADRSYDDVPAGHAWFSDHHKLDIICYDEQGNAKRPWVTVWRDVKTGYWLSYHLRHADPSAEIVSSTFIDGIRQFGKPHDAIVDNGKDYRSRQFTGGRKLGDEARAHSTLLLLGVKPHFTIPYHGQSKTLERDFKTFADGFSKFSRGYVGNKPGNRPESLEARIKAGDIPTLDEVRQELELYIQQIFHMQRSEGKVLRGRSRAQAWEEEFRHDLPRVTNDDLHLLHAKLTDVRMVRRGAVEWNGHRWYHEDLILHNKRRVFLRIPHNDTEGKAIVHDAETSEAICEARCDALRTPALARSMEERETVSAVMRSIRATEKRLKKNISEAKAVSPETIMDDLRAYLASGSALVRGEKVDIQNKQILGRTLAADVVDMATGEVVAFGGQVVTENLLQALIMAAIDGVQCEKEPGNIAAYTPMTEVRRSLEEKRATGTDGYSVALDYTRPEPERRSTIDLYGDLE